jgi:galactonate dehydratase
MKITGVRPVIVNAEMRNWVFVKVETDEGLVGWGEASLEWKTRAVAGCRFSPRSSEEAADRLLHLLGDPALTIIGSFVVIEREQVRIRRLPG